MGVVSVRPLRSASSYSCQSVRPTRRRGLAVGAIHCSTSCRWLFPFLCCSVSVCLSVLFFLSLVFFFSFFVFLSFFPFLKQSILVLYGDSVCVCVCVCVCAFSTCWWFVDYGGRGWPCVHSDVPCPCGCDWVTSPVPVGVTGAAETDPSVLDLWK